MGIQYSLIRNGYRALALRKQSAACHPLLDVSIATPSAFVKDLWDLYGTSQKLIKPNERIMLMLKALEMLTIADGASISKPDARGDSDNASLYEPGECAASNDTQGFPLNPTLGTARLLSSFVSRYSGVEAFDALMETAPQSFDDFPNGQKAALQALYAYRQLCEKNGLIEEGAAAAYLVGCNNRVCDNRATDPIVTESLLSFDVSIPEALFPIPAVENFLARLVEDKGCVNGDVYDNSDRRVIHVPVDARFLLLTGSTIITAGTYREIQAALNSGCMTITVFAKDPLRLYQALSPYLVLKGCKASCKASMPFMHTELGHTLSSAYQLHEEQSNWKDAATDFAYSSFSGMSETAAQNFNSMLRANSLMMPEQAQAYLREESPLYPAFEQFLQNPLSVTLETLQETTRSRKGVRQNNHIAEEAAFDVLESVTSLAQEYDTQDLLLQLLEGSSVSFAQECSPTGCDSGDNGVKSAAFVTDPAVTPVPLIQFLPLKDMDTLAPQSVDCVIFTDMTKDSFTIPRARPATDAILERIGIEDNYDRRDVLRAGFTNALAAAKTTVSFMVPLRDLEGKQKYPSFIYDEFVDALISTSGAQPEARSACHDDLSDALTSTFETQATTGSSKHDEAADAPASKSFFYADIDTDELYKIPTSVKETDGFAILDEVDVIKGFGETFCEPVNIFEVKQPTQGHLTIPIKDKLWMSKTDPDKPVLSPSKIEAYWDCPYKWFISYQVGVNSIDEEFNAMNSGSLLHKVMKNVFEALAQEGIRQVTPENVEHVRAVAAEEFDKQRARELSGQPLNRCVPVMEEDITHLSLMRQDLLNAISCMTKLPDDFAYNAGEMTISANDGIEYAGAIINGRVDRVDIAEDGRFIVYDYKGSLFGHDAGYSTEHPEVLPRKVQALIYAQSLMRTSKYANMMCAGALYLSYRAAQNEPFLSGSLDPEHAHTSEIASRSKSNVKISFQDFLDLVEKELAQCVRGILEGNIVPDPQDGACAFCDMVFCNARVEG